MKEDKFDNLKKLIAMNELELFFDQVLEEIKIYGAQTEAKDLGETANEIILFSQNYFSLKKEVRLNLIAINDYRIQNNRLVAGLLAVVDSLSKDIGFAAYLNGSGQDSPGDAGTRVRALEKSIGLLVTEGSEKGRIYNITTILRDKSAIKIGRLDLLNPKNNHVNVVETDRFMSRKHATIVKSDVGDYYIKDGQEVQYGKKSGWQQSLNGLTVNGTDVGMEGTRLLEDDLIKMGETIFKVIEL